MFMRKCTDVRVVILNDKQELVDALADGWEPLTGWERRKGAYLDDDEIVVMLTKHEWVDALEDYKQNYPEIEQHLKNEVLCK